ncbi:MAG: zinc transporter ZntB [Paracoccaceae bacterium]|nr:zinc transporter ZntB [Paracoccaceae bacterium]
MSGAGYGAERVALRIDGEGQARPAEGAAENAPGPGYAFVWLRHRAGDPETAETLRAMGLPGVAAEALTAAETWPRSTVHGAGVVLNLRGVNLNAGADPEDMISARLWIEEARVVGVWLRPLMAVSDLFDAIERGQGPVSPGDLVAKLALRLADRAEPTVAKLNERIDALEEKIIDDARTVARSELAAIRQQSIALRRYMFPQRDALSTLQIEDLAWLGERDRGRLREAADRVTRLCEDLDALRDRAQIVQDQLADQRSETMNTNMMVLSLVAAIFLPLGLLTGLLGINVAGIPGTENPWAFWIVGLLLAVLVAEQVVLFRRYRIIG